MKLFFLLLILFPLTVLSNRRYYACKNQYYNNLVFCYEDDNEINCVSNSDNYFTYKDNKCFYIHNKSIDKIIISKYYQIKNFDTFVLCQYSENILNDETDEGFDPKVEGKEKELSVKNLVNKGTNLSLFLIYR